MLDLPFDDPTHVTCVSDAPGHTFRPDALAHVLGADGTPWRLTRVGARRIDLVDPTGEQATWWVHDPQPFVQHLRTADPTVWVHDGGLVRVGDQHLSVSSRERWTACFSAALCRPGRQVAWLAATHQPDPDTEGADLLPPHTATLYRLDPPLRLPWHTPERPSIEWVLVLAHYHAAGGTTAIYPADATGRIESPGDLPGSHDEGVDHVRALEGLGYEIGLPPAPEG